MRVSTDFESHTAKFKLQILPFCDMCALVKSVGEQSGGTDKKDVWPNSDCDIVGSE